ncbi:MAG: DNA polymerase III subunit epsilon [Gammaproteobacteria bacterium]|nr:MAG: DNA polymerase III subunit epsilon [Gammaproteobacteria bacterium]
MTNRRIVLDTETTGMPAADGHRIIEIGCVEMLDRDLTGATYHQYINPQRPVEEGAYEVHGISNDFLADKPIMASCMDDFLHFIHGAELIIHNATFDVGFLNYELELLGKNERIADICTVTDTLAIARKKHPGARVNLDALSKRYGIKHFNRELHGALLDAEILAQVYLAMTGGQNGLSFAQSRPTPATHTVTTGTATIHIAEVPVSDEELARHQAFFQDSSAE